MSTAHSADFEAVEFDLTGLGTLTRTVSTYLLGQFSDCLPRSRRVAETVSGINGMRIRVDDDLDWSLGCQRHWRNYRDVVFGLEESSRGDLLVTRARYAEATEVPKPMQYNNLSP